MISAACATCSPARRKCRKRPQTSGRGGSVCASSKATARRSAVRQYGLRCQVAVLSRPDEDKGELLIAVTNESRLQLDEIRAAIKAKGLANLWMPREVKHVREIPKLGTGKVNHRELAKLI